MEGILASLRISVVAVAISATIGSAAGIAAGFFGGWTDRAVGLVTNIMFAFPAILLALAVVTALGRGWTNTVIAIAVVYTPIFVRVARGPVLSVRELDFVKAGRVLGFGRDPPAAPPRPAQRHRADRRAGRPRPVVGDPHRVGAELPRPRHAAARIRRSG